MQGNQIKKWFEKELKNYDDPFWCYHDDLRNMLDNTLERINENAKRRKEMSERRINSECNGGATKAQHDATKCNKCNISNECN